MSEFRTARFEITSRYTFEVPLEYYGEGRRDPEAVLEVEKANAQETLLAALEEGSVTTTVEFLGFAEEPDP